MSELAAEVSNNNLYNRVIKAKEAMIVSLGIVLTDVFAHSQAGIQAGSGVVEHLEKAVPSAFVAPNVGADALGITNPLADRAIDIGIEAGPAAASIALLRNSPEKASIKELAAIGLVAQTLAATGDAALAQERLLSHVETKAPDVGFSAIYVAYFTKLIFDKIGHTESERLRRIRQAMAAAAAGALIVATSYIDKDNFMTDTVSHAAGVLTGAGASALGRRTNTLQDDAAAQDFEPAIENG